MHVVGNDVTLRVDDKAAVFQDGRRDIHLHILAQEPAFHLVIAPAVLRVDGSQSLHQHLHAVGQLVDARQAPLVLLAHHHPLVLAQRVLAQPERHQCDAQRVEIDRRCYLHFTVDDVVVHLGSCIHRRPRLRGAVQPLVVLHQAGDAEVAQHHLLVLLVAEEEVAGFDVLVYDIVVMAIGQGGGSLQGYAAELVEVAVQVILCQRSALQVFHQLVVTVFPVDVGLSVVGYLDHHLHVEVLDDPHQLLLEGEVRVIHLQHPHALVAFYQEDLRLA